MSTSYCGSYFLVGWKYIANQILSQQPQSQGLSLANKAAIQIGIANACTSIQTGWPDQLRTTCVSAFSYPNGM